MEARIFSETLVTFYQLTRRHILEDLNLWQIEGRL